MRAIMLAVILLAACSDGVPEMDAALAECKTNNPAPAYVARSLCVNAAQSRIYPMYLGTPLLNATRLRLGEELQAGTITPTQADEQFQRAALEAKSRAAAIVGGMNALMPRSMNCVQIGYNTNCTEY
jgi:hypothetical protein